MAKVRIKASEEAFEKAGKDSGDFVVPPKGYYTAILKECNAGFSKDNDGNEDKKRPRLECIYEIVGVGREDKPTTENYGNLWDYVSFSKESEWKRAEFLLAMGLSDGSGSVDIEIDTDEVTGKKVLLRVSHEKGRNAEDGPRARVGKLLPWEDADASEAFGGGDSEEAFGEETSEEEGDDLYTEADLKEMAANDLKALGALAKEYEIDPNEYVMGKGKKKTVDTDGLIAAILEAQSEDVDSSGGDAEDEDSPF